MTIYVTLSRERITAVGFTNSGCAISKASASLMTDAVKDKTVDQVQELHDRIVTLLESTIANENTLPDSLKILYVVREYPSRISCATPPLADAPRRAGEPTPGWMRQCGTNREERQRQNRDCR